jgi:hypothetical protein
MAEQFHTIPVDDGQYAVIAIDPKARTARWVKPEQGKALYKSRQAAAWHREREERKEMKALLNVILEQFLESEDFKSGIISATRASWSGSGYSVELLPDTDTWRVLWNNQVGNLYNSPGIILGLPTFTDDESYQEAVHGENPMLEEDYFDLAFAIEEEELKQEMRDQLLEVV